MNQLTLRIQREGTRKIRAKTGKIKLVEIYSLYKTYWVVDDKGNRKRRSVIFRPYGKSLKFDDKQSAYLAKLEFEKKSILGTLGIHTQENRTFEDVAEEWLHLHRVPVVKKSTFESYRIGLANVHRVFKKVFKFHGTSQESPFIHEIHPKHLSTYHVVRGNETVPQRNWKQDHQKKIKPRTIKLELWLIKRVLEFAVSERYIRSFDFKKFPRIVDRKKKNREIFTEEEFLQLLKAASCPQVIMKLLCFFETGARTEEVHHIELSNIDLENLEIKIRKNKRREGDEDFKFLPISRHLAELLAPLMTHRYSRHGRELLPRTKAQSRYLFCHPNGAHHKHFRPILQRTMKAAGIEKKLTPHSIRHTFASQALLNGASLETVKDLLGHSMSTTTLSFYSHSLKKHTRDDFEKIPYIKNLEGKVLPLDRRKKGSKSK